jgi:hypothetical protein
MTLSTIIVSQMTYSKMTFNKITLSGMSLNRMECLCLFAVMPDVIQPSAILLNVVAAKRLRYQCLL